MTRLIILYTRFCVWRQARWNDKAERANEKALRWQGRWLAVRRWAEKQAIRARGET